MIAAVKLLSGVLLVPGPEIMRFFRFGAKAAPSCFRVWKCGLAGTLAARDVGSAALLLAPQMILPRGSSSAYSPAALPRFGPAKRFSVSPLRPATQWPRFSSAPFLSAMHGVTSWLNEPHGVARPSGRRNCR